MSQTVRELMDYISCSPTAFHAVENLSAALSEAGFEHLNEGEEWNVGPGSRFYVTRNRSALIAVKVPVTGLSPFRIVASHSDSPMFKLKTSFEDEVAGKYLRLDTECYGGMLMASWFDRPLSVAGRLLVREGDKLITRLTDLGRDAVLIPNMPIHFNREVNNGYRYDPQTDLLPLSGGPGSKGLLLRELAENCGADPDSVAGADLYVYDRMPGTVWGARGEFFSCPRIDDLECAWTSFKAFLGSEAHGSVSVCAVFDNEEVGSGSKQGADSTFLHDVLTRTAGALGAAPQECMALIAASFMASADNAHAVHPNHPEKYDAQNRAWMNEGVVIKHNAAQKYTTDAVSAAVFSEICRRASVPVQHFSNRSDIPGGSTLGNIANSHASMNTVDIGLAQLAMHSAYETAGVEDVDLMVTALKAFWEARLGIVRDGEIVLA